MNPPAVIDRRLPSLDGWRAVAIALVLLSHEYATHSPPALGMWLPLFSQGALGVRVFFVLSGFLITHLLIREHMATGTISLRNFYARRALRILPVYYLFLLCLAGLWVLGLHRDAPSTWVGALTFTRNMVGSGPSANLHLWSLAVEEQFYVIWPASIVLLGLAARWRSAAFILTAVIVLSFASRLPECGTPSFLCQRILAVNATIKSADALAVGCLLAIFESRGKLRMASPGINMFVLWLCILGLVALAIPPACHSRLTNSTVLVVQALLIGGAIYTSLDARSSHLAYRVLNCAPMVYLGVLSYSLYVWHMLFLSYYMGPAFAGSVLYDRRVWWIPALLVAMCSYHFYERPIASLRKRFGYSQP